MEKIERVKEMNKKKMIQINRTKVYLLNVMRVIDEGGG